MLQQAHGPDIEVLLKNIPQRPLADFRRAAQIVDEQGLAIAGVDQR
jgi:hypothetical protein